MDFDKSPCKIDNAEPEILDLCRIDDQPNAEVLDYARDDFVELYFDGNGLLRLEYKENLRKNPAFIAAAIDRGYFIFTSDPDDRIKIE